MDFYMGGFSVFFGIFGIFFVIIFGLILIILIRGIIEWRKNNISPKIPAEAVIVAKRVMHGGHEMRVYTSSYYVTFEFLSGDRKEFPVPPGEYGLLAEGDTGILTFQGTRYISFERKI